MGWARFTNAARDVFSGYSSREFSALLLASVPPLPRGVTFASVARARIGLPGELVLEHTKAKAIILASSRSSSTSWTPASRSMPPTTPTTT